MLKNSKLPLSRGIEGEVKNKTQYSKSFCVIESTGQAGQESPLYFPLIISPQKS